MIWDVQADKSMSAGLGKLGWGVPAAALMSQPVLVLFCHLELPGIAWA